MLSLKERIAARKAAEAAASGIVQPVTQEQANSSITIDVPVKEISPLASMGLDNPDTGLHMTQTEIALPVAPEPPPAPSNKPMTFAERMALKKKLAEQSDAAPAPAPSVPAIQAVAPSTEPYVAKLTDEQLQVLKETDDPELAQAYSDVALAINKLAHTDDGEPLANAMSDLKKALKKNLSASMLILDSDLGQMVLALRRYTGIELAEAKEKKTTSTGTKTRRAAPVSLTAEDIAKALATDF